MWCGMSSARRSLVGERLSRDQEEPGGCGTEWKPGTGQNQGDVGLRRDQEEPGECGKACTECQGCVQTY